ncbi:Uncharacterised protein [Yersinia frederiksenii]|uniref:Uncharacterized protein n=2 Tax=Yersinia frederiksenii TaxID=29484 RepID=A0A380PVC2_YERFR|nr:hypothetical protein [Yersinia frederiksenii]ATM94060.1 hypothetical protein CRN75_00785 [Yersinia frederiksenii]KGA45539.1 putative membrane protein [Yersinia frederiksenii ATCC 33641]MDN0119145.1 hypothetical protein [Yersinia frederiksenii]CNC93475.1 Uncharacterised protein [Yersinia frederiksenii]CNG08550.1 Uncharacterised protein [Yersinia frederiksenii]
MNNYVIVIACLNIVMKILFYTFFYMTILYLSSFILDGRLPEVGNKIYISIFLAAICTFIPFFDGMKKFIDAYLRIRKK